MKTFRAYYGERGTFKTKTIKTSNGKEYAYQCNNCTSEVRIWAETQAEALEIGKALADEFGTFRYVVEEVAPYAG